MSENVDDRDYEIASIAADAWDDYLMGAFLTETGFSALDATNLDAANVPGESAEDFEATLDLNDDSPEQSMTLIQPHQLPITGRQLISSPPSPAPTPTIYTADLADVDAPSIRLLLNRYQQKLVPAFAPVQVLPKSPWQIVHIPKVHETLGEVLIRGDAGNANVALLFAVLSAAAFHLDALGINQDQESLVSWNLLAHKFRSRAKDRLKCAFMSLSSGTQPEDYADMLLALLSMVTVCVSQLYSYYNVKIWH